VGHQPALADDVVELLLPALALGGTLVDATLGRAGHARRLLEEAPSTRLVGIDRDPEAVEASRADLAPYGERVRLVRAAFQDLEATLERLGVAAVRGVLFDLGVSSPQLDAPERGFSYRFAGPLDMRMDPSQPLTAEQVVNNYSERDLERVIRRYGEERFARRIAAAIVRSRPHRTTDELADVVARALPAAARRRGGHPARRSFQALRIEVNHELDALRAGLPAALAALEPGGRVAVISYHSLEDRIVKTYFAEQARGCACPPDLPVCRCAARARLRVLTRRPVRPRPAEIAANPRSKAAKLRAAERLGDAAA
jgi:16S rRNA (cytosine1402-N4)-methyltransferase